MRKKISKEYLKCVLTADEFKSMSSDLAQQTVEIQELEDQKKAASSDFKSRIDAATAHTSRIARILRDGYEMKDVECETTFDLESGMVVTVRKDTGEIYKTRPMSQDERQQEFDFLQKAQEQAAADPSGPTEYNGKGHLALPDPDTIEGEFTEDSEDEGDAAEETEDIGEEAAA